LIVVKFQRVSHLDSYAVCWVGCFSRMISPNGYPNLFNNHWDIVFPSQVENYAPDVTFLDCILAIRNTQFGWMMD